MPTIDSTVLGPLISLVGAIASWMAYLFNQRIQPIAQASKLMDRMYELGKLVLQYPDDFAAFMAEAQRQTPFFWDKSIPRDARYFRLKSFVYFHLDFFEEIYLATQDSRMNAQFEGEYWQSYILDKMRHPLIKEVFYREAAGIYKGKFSEFVAKNSAHLAEPCDPDAW